MEDHPRNNILKNKSNTNIVHVVSFKKNQIQVKKNFFKLTFIANVIWTNTPAAASIPVNVTTIINRCTRITVPIPPRTVAFASWARNLGGILSEPEKNHTIYKKNCILIFKLHRATTHIFTKLQENQLYIFFWIFQQLNISYGHWSG